MRENREIIEKCYRILKETSEVDSTVTIVGVENKVKGEILKETESKVPIVMEETESK